MFGFLLKKWFFTFWDNLLVIIILNLCFTFIVSIALYVFKMLSFSSPAAIAWLVAWIFIINIYAAVVSMLTGKFTEYKSIQFKDVKEYFVFSWKTGITSGIVMVLQFFLGSVIVPFYLNTGGFLGVAALSLLFWLFVAWIFASQYLFPICKQLDRRPFMAIKKSFLILFDNTFLTVEIGLISFILIALSVFTALVIPGIAGVLLLHQAAFQLLLLKYNYLEENPGSNRIDIPWAKLFVDETEKIGKRTLKGMIFPWKE